MASYNFAMIKDFINQHYPGLPMDDQFITNIMNNSRGGDGGYLDQAIQSSPQYQQQQQQQAQQKYQQGIDTAVSTLQTGKSSLADQYKDLLSTVTGEYTPLINQQTANTGAELARRGLSPDSFLSKQTVGSALQPIYGQEAANAQQIGAGSISDTNAYTSAIANIQAGAAGTSVGIPLQYGSLALAQQAMPAQIQQALAQANALNTQAKYIPTSIGGMIFNTGNNSFSNPAMSILQQLGLKLTP